MVSWGERWSWTRSGVAAEFSESLRSPTDGHTPASKSCLKQYGEPTPDRAGACVTAREEPVSKGIGRLLVLTGLPGSSKTTLATQLAAFPACRMCPDDWMMASGIGLWDEATRARIEAFQADMSLELLRAGQNVVIEWGLWASRRARRPSQSWSNDRCTGGTTLPHRRAR